METIRIARDFGNVSALLPDGIDTIHDLPYVLHGAISLTLRFLQFDELEEKEMPAKSIWLNPEALHDHFAQVKRDRERKYSSKGDIEDPVDNEAVKGLIVGG